MKKIYRYGAFLALLVSALAFGAFTHVLGRTININRNDVDAAVFDAARSDATAAFDASGRDALIRDTLARDAIRQVNADPIAISGGYNSVVCSNLTTTPVYFGDQDVSSTDGYAICAAATCNGSVIGLEAYQGVVYAVVASSSDAGVNITCIAGH